MTFPATSKGDEVTTSPPTEAATAAPRRYSERPRDGDGDGFVYDGTPRMRPFNPLTDLVGKAVTRDVVKKAAKGDKAAQDKIRRRVRANRKTAQKVNARQTLGQEIEAALGDKPTNRADLSEWNRAADVIRAMVAKPSERTKAPDRAPRAPEAPPEPRSAPTPAELPKGAQAVRDAAQQAGKVNARVADNRMARAGIRKGDTIEVEYRTPDKGRVRITSANGRQRAYDVQWQRFDQVVDAPEPDPTPDPDPERLDEAIEWWTGDGSMELTAAAVALVEGADKSGWSSSGAATGDPAVLAATLVQAAQNGEGSPSTLYSGHMQMHRTDLDVGDVFVIPLMPTTPDPDQATAWSQQSERLPGERPVVYEFPTGTPSLATPGGERVVSGEFRVANITEGKMVLRPIAGLAPTPGTEKKSKDTKFPVRRDREIGGAELDFTEAQVKEMFTFDLGDGYTARAVSARRRNLPTSAVTTWAVEGDIERDGVSVGSFSRKLSSDGAVTAKSLEIEADHGGKGVGGRFTTGSFERLAAAGFTHVDVTASSNGLANGGYTWARAGYDWKPGSTVPNGLVRRLRDLGQGKATLVSGVTTGEERERATQLADALSNAAAPREGRLIPDDLPDDFPTPNDVAMLGWSPGAKTWPGRELMSNMTWEGRLILPDTPEPDPAPDPTPTGTRPVGVTPPENPGDWSDSFGPVNRRRVGNRNRWVDQQTNTHRAELPDGTKVWLIADVETGRRGVADQQTLTGGDGTDVQVTGQLRSADAQWIVTLPDGTEVKGETDGFLPGETAEGFTERVKGLAMAEVPTQPTPDPAPKKAKETKFPVRREAPGEPSVDVDPSSWQPIIDIFEMDLGGGYSAVVDDVQDRLISGDSVTRWTVRGHIEHEDTEDRVGEFSRVLWSDGGVYADGLKIDREHRGNGIGMKFTAESFERLAAAGFTHVDVTASSSQRGAAANNGGYTWARAGYDWKPESRVPGWLLDHLRAKPRGVTDPDVVLDGAPDDVRAQAAAFADALEALPTSTVAGLEGPRFPADVADWPDDIPTPNDIAMLGYTPGAETWPGREIMLRGGWEGRMVLPGGEDAPVPPSMTLAERIRAEGGDTTPVEVPEQDLRSGFVDIAPDGLYLQPDTGGARYTTDPRIAPDGARRIDTPIAGLDARDLDTRRELTSEIAAIAEELSEATTDNPAARGPVEAAEGRLGKLKGWRGEDALSEMELTEAISDLNVALERLGDDRTVEGILLERFGAPVLATREVDGSYAFTFARPPDDTPSMFDVAIDPDWVPSAQATPEALDRLGVQVRGTLVRSYEDVEEIVGDVWANALDGDREAVRLQVGRHPKLIPSDPNPIMSASRRMESERIHNAQIDGFVDAIMGEARRTSGQRQQLAGEPRFDVDTPVPESITPFLLREILDPEPFPGAEERVAQIAELAEQVDGGWRAALHNPDDLDAIVDALDPNLVDRWVDRPTERPAQRAVVELAKVLAYNARREGLREELTADNLGANGWPEREEVQQLDPELFRWMNNFLDLDVDYWRSRSPLTPNRSVLGDAMRADNPDPEMARLMRMHHRAAIAEMRFQGIEEVTLYRAGRDDSNPFYTDGGSGLTSWTTDRSVAENYGTVIAEVTVTPDRVFSWDTYGAVVNFTGTRTAQGGDAVPLPGSEVILFADEEIPRRLDAGETPFNPATNPNDLLLEAVLAIDRPEGVDESKVRTATLAAKQAVEGEDYAEAIARFTTNLPADFRDSVGGARYINAALATMHGAMKGDNERDPVWSDNPDLAKFLSNNIGSYYTRSILSDLEIAADADNSGYRARGYVPSAFESITGEPSEVLDGILQRAIRRAGRRRSPMVENNLGSGGPPTGGEIAVVDPELAVALGIGRILDDTSVPQWRRDRRVAHAIAGALDDNDSDWSPAMGRPDLADLATGQERTGMSDDVRRRFFKMHRRIAEHELEGRETVRLYRAQSDDQPGAQLDDPYATRGGSGFTSWTTDRSSADQYGTQVWEVDVPVDQILSYGTLGNIAELANGWDANGWDVLPLTGKEVIVARDADMIRRLMADEPGPLNAPSPSAAAAALFDVELPGGVSIKEPFSPTERGDGFVHAFGLLTGPDDDDSGNSGYFEARIGPTSITWSDISMRPRGSGAGEALFREVTAKADAAGMVTVVPDAHSLPGGPSGDDPDTVGAYVWAKTGLLDFKWPDSPFGDRTPRVIAALRATGDPGDAKVAAHLQKWLDDDFTAPSPDLNDWDDPALDDPPTPKDVADTTIGRDLLLGKLTRGIEWHGERDPSNPPETRQRLAPVPEEVAPSLRADYLDLWDGKIPPTRRAVGEKAARDEPLWSPAAVATESKPIALAIVEALIQREERELARLDQLDTDTLMEEPGPLADALWAERRGSRVAPSGAEALGVARRDPDAVATVYGRWQSRADGKGTNANRRNGPMWDADLPAETKEEMATLWADVLADERVQGVLERFDAVPPALMFSRNRAGVARPFGEPLADYGDGMIVFRTRDMVGNPLDPGGPGPLQLPGLPARAETWAEERQTLGRTFVSGGEADFRGTLTHELGHYVHELLNNRQHPGRTVSGGASFEWASRWADYHEAMKREWDQIPEGVDPELERRRRAVSGRQVSYYSHQNALEGFAETFNAVLNGADRSNLTPEGLALMEFMDAVIGGDPIPGATP